MSLMTRHDIDFPQGDSFYRQVEFLDPAGQPIDLTGYTAEFQVRNTPMAIGALLTLDTGSNGGVSFMNDDPTTGTLILSIAPRSSRSLVPGDYSYALKIMKDDDTYTVTLLHGHLTVKPETAR
jgi:hypothetical protein